MKHSSQNKTDRHIPVDLKAPEYSVHPKAPKNNTPLIVILFILLIISTGYVILILPGLSGTTSTDIGNSITDTRETADLEADHEKSNEKTSFTVTVPAETEEMRNRLYLLKIQAESENITGWAPEKYTVALDMERHADHLYEKNEFGESTDAYRNAVTAVTTILESKSQFFESSMKLGSLALENGNGKEAMVHFGKALAIHPTDAKASRGLKRSETIEEVTALHQKALVLEKSGELDDAVTVLENLLSKDPYYHPGKQSLQRVSKAIENKLFNQEMSQFFVLLETGSPDRLKDSIATLKKLKNGHPEVIKAEKLFIEKKETDQIRALQKKADIFVKKEQWHEALAVYNEVITIAPDALFAVNGQTKALKRRELDINLTSAITNQQRLQDSNYRQQVKKILSYAETITPQSPRLASQIQKLESFIQFAETPVPVTIDSDNITEITIYHVGNVGHFHSQTFSLTPGTYTITGSRTGFQDVRHTIEVSPQNPENRIHIQCTVPI